MAGVVGVIVAATLSAPGIAHADSGGAGTVTTTQHARDVVFQFPATNPCTNAPGTLTLTSKNEVFHATSQADGTFWITGNDEGTALFTPDDPSGVSASGPFHAWFGESSNQKNDVQHDTFTVVLTGSDGSHMVMRMVDHLSTNASGVVTAAFSKSTTPMQCA
jgi:hypothetical protein